MATNCQTQPNLTLSEDDLQEALEAVYSISPENIFNFGMKLGLNHSMIKTLQMQCNGDMKGWLREIVNERLKQEPPLTWHDIVTALRSPLVGEDHLASQIESHYMTHSQPPSSVPQRERAQLSSVPRRERAQLSSVPQRERAQLPSGAELSTSDTSTVPSSQLSLTADSASLPPPQPLQSTFHTIHLQQPHSYPPHIPQYSTSHPPSHHSHYHLPPQLYPPDQSLYQPQPMYYSTDLPRPSSRHHSLEYTATQLPSTQYPTHHTSSHPPLDHSHHQPLHYPAHQSQHVQSHPPSTHTPYHPTQYTHYTPPQQHSLEDTRFFAARPHPGGRSRPGPHPGGSHPRPYLTMESPHQFPEPNSFPYTTHSILPHEPVHILSPGQLQNSMAFVTYIDYVKTFYKESEVERSTSVVKWPPTPSKVYINLACIDRHSVSGRSREYDEVTEAMVRDGNVDAIKNVTKGPIDFSEIAKNISVPNSKQRAASNEINSDKRRLILVEGAPGVGKSTFAWEFCRRWERGEIAQQYQLVLLLRLREERISNAKSLEDIIYHPSKDVHQAVCHELLHSHDYHTLIILEGFDELPDACRKSGSIFMDLIAGKLLPLATILVTSRPWATQGIRIYCGNRIYQHIEILGFTGQQITEYIESTLPQDKVSDLKAYLESHPQIRAGMYIPLNSAIVVTVYEESQASGYAMPTTLTELYICLTQTLLLRYLRGHPEYETDSKFLETLKDLPPPVDGKFHKLCRLAYDGTVGTRHQVQLIFRGLPSDFDDLGFMDSVTELYVTRGAVSSHNFLHLTFQEFFAAVHISSMSPAQQVEHFKRHKEGRLKVVLRFLAGFNKLNCFSIEEIAKNFLQTPSAHEGSRYQISCDAAVGIDLVQWLFEAQSDDVIEHVLGQKTVEFDLPSGMLPLDYYSLGFCISHSQCQWVLGLRKKEKEALESRMFGVEALEGESDPWSEEVEKEIGEDEEEVEALEVRMLVAGAGTRRGASGSVVELKGQLEGYSSLQVTKPNPLLSMSEKCLSTLFTEWKSILHLHQLFLELPAKCDFITWPDLSALRMLKLAISGKTEWKLSTLLSHLSLESLTIAPTGNGDSLVRKDCVAIGAHVKSTTHLKELRISSTISDEKAVEAITAALASNQSLPLERLELECECTFTATAVDSLAQFITNTTTLQYLSISCTFSAHALLVLARAIHHNSILQTKNVEDFHLPVNGDDEVKGVAKLLVKYPKMVYISRNYNMLRLNLSNNSICDARIDLRISPTISDEKGVEAITAALASNQSLLLERLELECECTFTATAVDSLAQFITNTTTLQYLSIRRCTFSAHALLVLARAIHRNSILQTKNVEDFHLPVNGDDEVKGVAKLLVKYPEMVYVSRDYNMLRLNLSNKSISDAGAVALAQALHHNSSPTELDLSINSISDAGAVALAHALHHNSTLTELNLSNNSVSYAGAVALAQALHHNSTLTQLHLSINSISDTGAVALAQALHHNSTLTRLYLSNNSISDAGAVALAQALHHNSTLTQLYLYGNDGIGEEGTHQLVQALTVNTSISEYVGVRLPRRCEEYATQCPQYHTVKNRIHFYK